MATVITAQGYSISTDEHPRTVCTAEFAERMGLTIIEGSEREVPDSDIDVEGIYRPAKP